ncbi:uncharacterized protein LOC123010135 [Tribolium madens]|uniref:uncharacterized protein LOC123010135 n=1 Tax=Tribolium madens TaxID=41895 RepID=UPI001CF7593A|nr:uncharacterized protein LOC123010135 [Tribolium madens]
MADLADCDALDFEASDLDDGSAKGEHERQMDRTQVRKIVEEVFGEKLATQVGKIIKEQAALFFASNASAANSTAQQLGVAVRGRETGQMASMAVPTTSGEAASTPRSTGDYSGDLQGEFVATKRARMEFSVGAEIIDQFDPDSPDCNIEKWLTKIDQLGDVYGWSPLGRSSCMQARLGGRARIWFNRLETYDLTWTEWKVKLRAAFPRRQEFGAMIEEMVNRRKCQGETMTQYYHDKLALCERCGITGEKAVSCIVRGLPTNFRANALAYKCSSPDELYNGFLSGVDGDDVVKVESEHRLARATKTVSRSQGRGQANLSTSVASEGRIRCYNCQEYGSHFSRNCPKAKMERCHMCGEGGHTKANCPKAVAKSEPKKPKDWRDTRAAKNPTGFGGVKGAAHGIVTTKLKMDNVCLKIEAWATLCDISNADIILGQPALKANGLVVVIRDGRATLIKSDSETEKIGEFFANLDICEDDDGRPKVRLAEDLYLNPGETEMVKVDIEDAPRGRSVVVDVKLVDDDGAMVAIPSYTLTQGEDNSVPITNLGMRKLRWKAKRIIGRAERCTEQEAVTTVLQVSKSTSNSIELSEGQVGPVSGEIKRQLLELLKQKADCFAKDDSDLGLTHLGEMKIRLKTDMPIYHRPYRLSYSERAVVRQKVQTLLDSGVIRKSESDYASPIVLIPKKNGEWRLCVDYRALNAPTVKDRYPMAMITEEMDKMAGKRYFTTLDMAQGYHQIPMHPDSIDKTAFVTPDGHYEYVRVPFVLANAPAVFQRVVNKLLGRLRHEDILAYMDDLLIPSATAEGGLQLLEQVLELIRQAGIKLKVEKCTFLHDTVEYLGHKISVDGVRPGRRKIQAVVNFPTPQNVHNVRQFVGLASYFGKFINNFAVLARPLTDLTKQNVGWRWGDMEQKSFDKLKALLVDRPVLAIYDPKAVTELHTVASKLGIGGVLIQQQANVDKKPVAYCSRATTKAEQAYHSYELETLAIVESIKRFRVYLIGIHFKVVTDCASVRATLLKRDLEYSMEVDYRPGSKMLHVDALSRNPVYAGMLTLSEDHWFATVQLQDDKIQAIMASLTTGEADRDIKANFKVKNGRLFRITLHGDRLYVPSAAVFSLLRKHHDDIGHPGFQRCLALIKETYWFPRMRRQTSIESEARWCEKLPEVVWGLNQTINESTRFSPAQLTFAHKSGAIADLTGDIGGTGDTGGINERGDAGDSERVVTKAIIH